MTRASRLLCLVLTVILPAHLSAQAPRTIEIDASDAMKFSVTEIAARPGEELRVVLHAVGAMPKMAMAHNFVLLRAGVDPTQFTNDSVLAGAAASYIAPAREGEVLAHTTLAGAGETVEVTFRAPAAGTYAFLCSFPGHFGAGMKGTLVVK